MTANLIARHSRQALTLSIGADGAPRSEYEHFESSGLDSADAYLAEYGYRRVGEWTQDRLYDGVHAAVVVKEHNIRPWNDLGEFKHGQRVQIQDRDREPLYYPYATVVQYESKSSSIDGRYLVRYEGNGCEVWVNEYNVLSPQSDSDRAVQLAKRIWPLLNAGNADASKALSALVTMAGGPDE
jgi:hypothetical protein